MSINGIYTAGIPAGYEAAKEAKKETRKAGDFMRFAGKAAGTKERTTAYAGEASSRTFTGKAESTAASGMTETDAKTAQVNAAEGTSLENWQPEGANPFYGSKNGKFIAPKEIHALGNVPPGSKAVVIHPKVQEKMEQDPAYAKEIMERIDTWFTFDALRNEAICPGITARMSQAVAIGEDGNICNAVSSSAGEITVSSDEMVRAYYLRMAKRAEFMRYLAAKQIEESIQESVRASDLAMQAAARSKLAEMMQGGRIREIFGDEIAGTPTETVLEITRAQIWGS